MNLKALAAIVAVQLAKARQERADAAFNRLVYRRLTTATVQATKFRPYRERRVDLR